jgi:hypothetical protein
MPASSAPSVVSRKMIFKNGRIVEHNLTPKRYVWKAAGRAILLKINRARAAAGLVQIMYRLL